MGSATVIILANIDQIYLLDHCVNCLCSGGSFTRCIVDDAIVTNASYVESTSWSPSNLSCTQGTGPPEIAQTMQSQQDIILESSPRLSDTQILQSRSALALLMTYKSILLFL